MKKSMIISIVSLLVIMLLSACATQERTIPITELNTSTEDNEGVQILVEESEDDLPFEVQIDKTALQDRQEEQALAEESEDGVPFEVLIDTIALESRQEEQTQVFIYTELTDWSYSVQAENGRISNIGKNSFDYSVPKDKEQIEDTITIQFVNRENGKQYNCFFSLIFNTIPIYSSITVIDTVA